MDFMAIYGEAGMIGIVGIMFVYLVMSLSKKSDSFKTIEEAYVKECENLKDSDGHGRIDIVKHKIVEHKVVER